jgi:hypothetical protein
MVDSYVLGFVRRELSEKEYIRQNGLTEDKWRAASEPYVKSLLANFDFGLECILDGIATWLPRS